MNSKEMQINHSNRLQSAVFLAAFIALFAFFVWTLTHRPLMEMMFIRYAYYLVAALFVSWVITAARFSEAYCCDTGVFLKRYWKGAAVALFLSLVVFLSVFPFLRVLPDEAQLLTVSRSMAFGKTTEGIIFGSQYFDNFYKDPRWGTFIDQRPLFFPFLAHIFHVFLGYHVENLFWLNLSIFFGFSFLVYFFFKKYFGETWAISAQIFVAAQPVVTQCAASGGFDLLSIFFLFLSLFLFKNYLDRPSLPALKFLWITLLVFANTRYESILFAVVIAAALFISKLAPKDFWRSPFLFFSTLIFLMPSVWQQVLVRQVYFSASGMSGRPFFSLSYFFQNVSASLKSMFWPDFSSPFASAVNWVGALFVLSLLFKFLAGKRRMDRGSNIYIFSLGLIFSGYWLFVNFYAAGVADHPSFSRYFIVFPVLLSLCAALLFYHYENLRKRLVGCVLLSLLAFIVYHPFSIESSKTYYQYFIRHHRFVLDFLKKQPDKNFLVIDSTPEIYTSYEYGSINHKMANMIKGEVLPNLERHLYRDVFVIQNIQYTDYLPIPGQQLDLEYHLQTLAEMQNTPEYFIRISRVMPPAKKEIL